MKMHSQVKPWAEAAEAAGWTVEYTKGSHLRFTPPKGWTDRSGAPQRVLIHSSTPSDHRANLNFRAALRRAGLDI